MEEDDFQPSVPFKRKQKLSTISPLESATKHKGEEIEQGDPCVISQHTLAKEKGKSKATSLPKECITSSSSDSDFQEIQARPKRCKPVDTVPPGPSTPKKTKAQIKAETANEKRTAKYEAKAQIQREKRDNMLVDGKTMRCPSCSNTNHQRSTSSLCSNRTYKRKPPPDMERTSIIKTSLENTCRSSTFVQELQNVVKHVRDVTFVGSLFANHYFSTLLSEGLEVPPITHDLCYAFFSLVAGEGRKASQDLQKAYTTFKQLVPELNESKFRSRGYMTLISTVAKEYEEAIRQYVTANFKRRSTQYFLVCMSDDADSLCRANMTVKERRALAAFAYDVTCSTQGSWPECVEDCKSNRGFVERAVRKIKSFLSSSNIDDKTMNAEPHRFFPWLFHVLKRFEHKVFVTEPTPQNHLSSAYVHRMVEGIVKTTLSQRLISSLKVAVRTAIRNDSPLALPKKFRPLSGEEMRNLEAFIRNTATAIESASFKPEKFTDPKGTRRFTVLPLLSFQMRHITLDNQALGRLLRESEIQSIKTPIDASKASSVYFELFDMSKIGYPTLESLKSDKAVFWDMVRTDGVDLEFFFKKYKEPYDPEKKQSTPADLKDKVKGSVVWGVDPGMTSIFVAADGTNTSKHRVRTATTAEYYAICGFNRATQKRKAFLDAEPGAKRVIDEMPTLKTTDCQSMVTAIRYRMKHYILITEFYSRNLRYNRLKLKSYIGRQKGASEMAQRLLGGSNKYSANSSKNIRQPSETKWVPRCPNDTIGEQSRPVIIAFGNAAFSSSMKGKLPAPCKAVLKILRQKARKRRAATYVCMVDEFLTSQICPACETRNMKNAVESWGAERQKTSRIHAVLNCTKDSCTARYWNRDKMAATNILQVFIHMAMNNNQRPPMFCRPQNVIDDRR